MLRALFACLAVGLLAACSGAGAVPGASDSPGDAPPASHRNIAVRLIIKVPPKTRASRKPAYVSPATASLKYAIDGGTPVTVALSTSNPKCTASATSYLTCTIALNLAPGTHALSFTTLDANGRVLSANTSVSCDVRAGAKNQIPVTLGGVASSLAVFINSPAASGSQTSGYAIYGSTRIAVSIVPVDVDGNFILGPGAPQPAVLATPASTTLGNPSSSSPNRWLLTSNAPATDPLTPTQATLTVRATPVPNSGGAAVGAAVALSLYQPWLYVAATSNSSILTFDEQGHSVTHTGAFTGLTSIFGLAYNPDQQWLYIPNTNGTTYTVQTYDRQGGAATCTGCFATGLNEPGGITYDPHNRQLYVTNFAPPAISAYDYLGNAVSTAAFTQTNEPYSIAFLPTTGLLYVTNYASDTVTAYRESGGAPQTLAGTFPNLGQPTGIAYDPHNGLLYVSASGSGITAYDDQGRQQTLPGGFPNVERAQGIIYDPYDELLYVTNLSGPAGGSITAYSENGNQVSLAAPITGLANPGGMAFVP